MLHCDDNIEVILKKWMMTVVIVVMSSVGTSERIGKRSLNL